VIYMPVTTPRQKIDKTRAFGSDAVEVRLTGDYFDQTLAAAQAWCAQTGGHFLSPFDDADVIEGQASVAVEMLDELGGAPDLVILPVGGGGLSSGTRRYLSATAPDTRLLFVEPVGGASLTAALVAGGPVTLPRVDTFVDGAAVARIGARTFEVLQDTDPLDVLLAPEDRICGTIIEMLNVEGIVLEPAGALALDVLPFVDDRIAGRRVVCVTSGGNFDFERLPEVRERAQRFAGLKKYFILRLPQRPGALRDFLAMLGPSDDIARFEYLKKSARNFGTVLIGIETDSAESFVRLFAAMDAAGFVWRDITEDATLSDFLV
jgi:threonine dehydratase